MKQDLVNEEAALNTELIGIFGYPYPPASAPAAPIRRATTARISTITCGWIWRRMGSDAFELTLKTSTVFVINGLLFNANTNDTLTLKFDLASNGMIVKPDAIEGTRRAQVSLQGAYGSFVQAYLEYRKALAAYEERRSSTAEMKRHGRERRSPLTRESRRRPRR